MPKRIIITGVSRGLGRAMSLEFAAQGHTVCGCARSEKAIEELSKTLPAPHSFSVVDVTDDSQVSRWAKEMLEEGPPDLLINNAAIVNAPAPLWEVPAEEFSRLIDINIKGVYYVLRHFVPAMVRKKSGIIVNLSSGWGRSTSPEVAPYCASKFAVEGMTKALAEELPPGMAAIPLSPGVIHTEMLELCFGPGAEQHQKPDQWVKAAVPFLLSLGPNQNGESLRIG